MSIESLAGKDSTTEELVSNYLAIPKNKRISRLDLTSSAYEDFQSTSETCQEIVKAVKDEGLDLGVAEERISNVYANLTEEYPNNTKLFELLGLYEQARAHRAKAENIIRKNEPDPAGFYDISSAELFDVRRINENAARLLLIAQISANARVPQLTGMLITALFNARKLEEAESILQNLKESPKKESASLDDPFLGNPPPGSSNPHLN